MRRLIDNADAAHHAGGLDPAVVMGTEIVHDQDVAAPQLRQKFSLQLIDEPIAIGGLPDGAQDDKAALPNCSKESQVATTIHWNAVDEFLAALHPRVATAHRHAEPRLVEKHEPIRR